MVLVESKQAPRIRVVNPLVLPKTISDALTDKYAICLLLKVAGFFSNTQREAAFFSSTNLRSLCV